MIKIKGKVRNFVLLSIGIGLILIILFTPLEILKFLSLEVVGEPPINGRSWLEGVEELGGEISMRSLGMIGIVIIILNLFPILKWESKEIPKREIRNSEIITFFVATIIFFSVNFLIGYDWWDPDAFLGMGPLFIPSIASLILLGMLPALFKKVFSLGREDLAINTEYFKEISMILIIIAFGYGLVSVIWHCCSFFEPKMYFFFFIIKLIQLWGMCSYFFKYGFYLFMNKVKPWFA